MSQQNPAGWADGLMHFPWQLQCKSALVKIIVPVHFPSHRECSFPMLGKYDCGVPNPSLKSHDPARFCPLGIENGQN
ncbi:MAG: hypothetical protein OXC82_01770 [Rhodobacteraceae bacterium]|nr:hypothetical protein [Paracoccaceae bacterium]MCY4249156.1 hypothetical protein [Paracoccaceae bacterium]MCY4307001.1 hypothetical protein [Paracoccaceae bacterium]